MKHTHRITPGHIGGEYVEGNVIEVEVTQCDGQTANHVMWHFANWCLWGKEEDKIAWKGLSGFYGKEEIIHERARLGGQMSGAAMRDSGKLAEIGKVAGTMAMSEGGWLYENRVEYGRLGGIAAKERKLGIFSRSSEEISEIARKTYEEGKGLASMTAEGKTEAGHRGGTVSGNKHKENKTGVCGIPPEEHSERMSSTNQQKWVCPECGHISNAKGMNLHILREHNLPKTAKKKLESNG
jgi:general stress protein YciG